MKSTITIYGLTLYPYSLLMVGGGLVCFLMFFFITLKRHAETFDENIYVFVALAISFGVGLPCAMGLEALFKLDENGGFEVQGATFYGGVISAVIAFIVIVACIKNRKVPIYTRLTDLAPCIPAGHCLGRIGCFFGGCCFGKPTDSIFGVVFPEGSVPYEYYLETTGNGSVAIHPVQLYEAAALAAISLILLFVLKKHSLGYYFILYGIARFSLEFLRADDRGQIFNLTISPAQFISIILFVIGVAIVAAGYYREYKKRRPTVEASKNRIRRMCLSQSVKIKSSAKKYKI